MTRRSSPLFCALALLLLFVAGCEPEWKEKAEKAFRKGEAYFEAGDWSRARSNYEEALEYNPYHAEANLRLATLLETRFLDEARALHYYRRYLDLPAGTAVFRKRLEVLASVLDEIVEGRIEDPADAAADILWAVRNQSNRAFAERLHADFLQVLFDQGFRATEYFEHWEKRIEGRMAPRFVYRNVYKSRGRYKAEVWVDLVAVDDPNDVLRRKLRFRLEGTLWEMTADVAPEEPDEGRD